MAGVITTVKNLVAAMAAAIFLVACGTPAAISGSSVKSVAIVAAPNAAEVADGARHSTPAVGVNHAMASASRPAGPVPVIPASKPAAPRPAADGVTPHLNCESFSAPGKPKLMCVPQ